ncbi:MAG: heavy-metal-associated domain-containing protein [Acidimicrobiales bacterium]
MITATYHVVGMTCEHCVRAVQQEVGAIPTVSEVEVDLASGRVTVHSEQPLTDADFAAAIDEAGYEVGG